MKVVGVQKDPDIEGNQSNDKKPATYFFASKTVSLIEGYQLYYNSQEVQMYFLGLSLIVSAAIIAATFLYLFKTSIKFYKETYGSLFEKDDLVVETPDNNNTPEIKFGEF